MEGALSEGAKAVLGKSFPWLAELIALRAVAYRRGEAEVGKYPADVQQALRAVYEDARVPMFYDMGTVNRLVDAAKRHGLG